MPTENEPEQRPERRKPYDPPNYQRVLVAVMNRPRDLQIAREQGWYRIPVASAPRYTETAHYLAFYLTTAFRGRGSTIPYWAEIQGRRKVRRAELLPGEPNHPRASEEYYKLEIGPLQDRIPPIPSRKPRRTVFINTTWEKFQRARDINDLYHDSPLEDDLWAALQQERIEAERQFPVDTPGRAYYLDFAVFCQNGKVDVECDGDRWHADPARIPDDNDRNNALGSIGWSVLRFNGTQLRDEMPQCVAIVRETVNRYGGQPTADGEVRYFATGRPDRKQLNLFAETPAEYETAPVAEEGTSPDAH